jgi:hypothetical protein
MMILRGFWTVLGYTLFIASVVFLLCRAGHAAEFFVEGGAGLTQFLKTSDDGVWIQDRMPHTTDWRDLALRGGLGVKFSENVSLGANYVRLGAVQLDSTWQSDEIYNSKCGLSCDHYAGHLTGTMQGGELVGTYHPQLWAISPIVRAGLATMQHTLHWTTSNQAGAHTLRGVVVMGVVGAGVCYQTWLCGDVSYYRGFADTNFPLSTGAVVSMVSLKYTF